MVLLAVTPSWAGRRVLAALLSHAMRSRGTYVPKLLTDDCIQFNFRGVD